MKTYEEVIATVANNAFSDYMGGGEAKFPEYQLVGWIYNVNPNKAYADFKDAFLKLKHAYYANK